MKKYIILIPVYNDWQSVFKLIQNIDLQLNDELVEIIIVNDASTEKYEENLTSISKIKSVKIINLNNNGGHRRAIATGLKYCKDNLEFDCIIPMDGDGEDRPEEIKEFLNQIKNSNGIPIVGERIKRSENLLFKCCYQLHKLITLTFTGKSIKYGNFTCLPKTTVEKMINEKATWNSFSGSLKKTQKNLLSIPSIRGTRYHGPSKMNFSSLLKHSLSIISVFRSNVLIRSALFIPLYILLIKSNASIITAIPLLLLLVMIYSISNLALRENMEEFDNSLKNILDITIIK